MTLRCWMENGSARSSRTAPSALTNESPPSRSNETASERRRVRSCSLWEGGAEAFSRGALVGDTKTVDLAESSDCTEAERYREQITSHNSV